MKKLLVLVLLALVAAAPAWSADTARRPFAPVQDGFVADAPLQELWAPSRVLIQFTPNSFERFRELDPGKAGDSIRRTGLADLDGSLDEVQAGSLRALVPQFADKAAGSGYGLDRWYVVELEGVVDAVAARERLLRDANLADVELDYVAFPTVVPNDPLYYANWGHNNTGQLPGGASHTQPGVGTPGFDSNAQSAWNETQGYGDSGVIIAILDTGVDPTHPDLVQVPGYDFGDNDSDPSDDSGIAGHGTACAGIAAAIADNALGVTGIAGGCRIMPLKLANTAGVMYVSVNASAITWAADNGADVISMSFGSGLTSYGPTDAAISYADGLGVTLLGATGNDNDNQIHYPAYNPLVIGVGAASPCGDRKRSSSSASQVSGSVNTDPNGTTCDGEYWWGSNYGPAIQNHQGAVDVIAPTILPTTDIQGFAGYSHNNYSSFFNGTSCATPYAAGICALIKSKNPSFTPNEVRAQLVGSAQDIVNVESGAGWDRYTGYGMVDAAGAVGAVIEPPVVAGFSADLTSGCAPLTVSFTDETAGEVDTWTWDFGDGLGSIAQNPTHTYDDPGVYDVTLTASGPPGGDGLTKAGYIVVGEPPVVDFSSSVAFPTLINAGDSVDFTDLSTGDPTAWSWDFGDGGSSTEQNPSHVYTAAGVYGVSLTATNACGSGELTKLNLIAVIGSVGPTADFGFDPADGCAPLEVAFTDLSTGSPTGWDWDFGDGGGSTDQNPTHTYTAPGTFDVTLTVTNSGGSDEKVVAGAITVGGPPSAAFAISDTLGLGPFEVTFTDESTGGATAWSWDFGDGGGSSEQSPTHTFTAEGYFTVRLIASGTCGADTLIVTDGVHVNGLSPVGDEVPVAFGLGRNYPNPFNPSTMIVFSLEKPGRARLDVFDVSGRLLARLVDAHVGSGRHEVEWRPDDLASGVYFARLVAGDRVDTRRVTLLK